VIYLYEYTLNTKSRDKRPFFLEGQKHSMRHINYELRGGVSAAWEAAPFRRSISLPPPRFLVFCLILCVCPPPQKIDLRPPDNSIYLLGNKKLVKAILVKLDSTRTKFSISTLLDKTLGVGLCAE
jgi:hypothetical protein